MVDLGRVGRRLWWLLVRSVEVVLALAVLVAVLVLGDLPKGPDAPEQTATIAIPFLVVWGLATVLLLALVGVRAFFEGSRLASGDDLRVLRRRAGRAAAEMLFGFLVVATLELVAVAAGGFATVLAATAAVAWAVVVHHFVDALLFCWSLLASG